MNRHHNPRKDVKASRDDKGAPPADSMPERTAAWPGVPGKTQPGDFPGGAKRVTGHAKSEGI
jgi:hypothetical protein